ncbi:Ribonuclease HII [Methanosarcina siciliae T4/M]|uniref:Ribonuclease HII n=2 Tax=Methanosarcina siciliae TaxID=38027 RepID=A0A0E3PEC7_9EURY|nr:ribonuclease HII [Methanosarcina siciliae]AKB28562.1 Ribonuclease HII [Methanosarcina siciliae T4/M]AKB32473.1 Ribonuclease HII [Methanosarcina siciliae HI350]
MMIAGIDEAGKGPVIGPMCIGGVKIEESRAHILKVLGVADSKKLTPKKREQLASQIKKHAEGFFILEISPSQIDELRKIMSMNEIMVICFAKVLEQLKPDIVYADAADVKAERFAENLRRQYAKTSPAHAKKIEIISMHQADATYPVVSAASIIAKVRRDELIEELKKEWGVDFGSGYPSDPKTKAFLLKWGKEHGGKFPEIVRQSWQTVENVRKELEKSGKE